MELPKIKIRKTKISSQRTSIKYLQQTQTLKDVECIYFFFFFYSENKMKTNLIKNIKLKFLSTKSWCFSFKKLKIKLSFHVWNKHKNLTLFWAFKLVILDKAFILQRKANSFQFKWKGKELYMYLMINTDMNIKRCLISLYSKYSPYKWSKATIF